MGRIARSFELVGQSWRILLHDKELVALPLMSGVILLGLSASFFFAFDVRTAVEVEDGSTLWLPGLVLYAAAYAVGFYFQAAIVAGATERLRGGDPTLGSALAAANRRLGPILMWALVAATVGMILRSIQERAGFIGKIAIALVGVAWSLATFFVVPVLVLEDRSVRDSVSRSTSLFKQTWGESLAGTATLGIAAFFAWITLIGIVALLAYVGLGLVAVVFAIAGVILLATVFPALDGIFVAALYAHATSGSGSSMPGADALARTFAPGSNRPSSIRF